MGGCGGIGRVSGWAGGWVDNAQEANVSVSSTLSMNSLVSSSFLCIFCL